MTTRARLIAAAAAVVLALGAGAAWAAFPDTNVETYTGCLTTSGLLKGVMDKLAVGGAPMRPCGPNQQLAHVGGGDITKVTAGAGLTGGGEAGAVTLGLDAGHSLPQGCGSGQVATADGAGAWSCADQGGSSYTAGTGLDLSASTFSLKPGYRLPQGCSDGEAAIRTLAGPGAWGCTSFANADTHCTSGAFADGIDTSGNVTCAVPTSGGGSVPAGPEVWVAHNTSDDNAPLETAKTFAQFDLPPGTYVVDANGTASDDASGNGQIDLDCWVSAGAAFGGATVNVDGGADSRTAAVPLTIHALLTVATTTTVIFYCYDHNGSDSLHGATMTALKVGTLNQ